ncbi:hypothetical protein JCM33374_g3056 [Metschnikowia sp. JCM 33374]|nr:hypothetical protein JCM33374_g3056 [Metschnikowia sp. JCM 33374]
MWKQFSEQQRQESLIHRYQSQFPWWKNQSRRTWRIQTGSWNHRYSDGSDSVSGEPEMEQFSEQPRQESLNHRYQ